MKRRLSLGPICLIFLWPMLCTQAQTANPHRTVMDTELGSIFDKPFAYPNGFPYSDYGAYIGAGRYSTSLNPDAIKGHYSHFNHFGPGDALLGFPYTQLRQFEAHEIASGRPPIFITATYEGKKRPVLFLTYLQLDKDNRPTTASDTWAYAVNIADLRFIKFWINRYARPVVLQPMLYLRNAWVYVDGTAFSYLSYGVLDDTGRFVAGVPWDPPFQSNSNDYLKSVATFFNTVKAIAPDIKINTDTGTMSDSGQFPTVYANIPGATAEDLYYQWHARPTHSQLRGFYNGTFSWFSWLGSHNRVAVMGAYVPQREGSGALLSGFIVYELLKGPNFFFAPRIVECPAPVCPMEPPTSQWFGWKAKLGNPISAFQNSAPYPGGDVGNRLYWRQYSDGYVYLNWTGVTQTVTLPAGKWTDPNNTPVTKIQIPTWTGTFVSVAGQPQTAAAPSISPRSPYNITGPLAVTIANDTPGATIRYTVNGTIPNTSSPVYTGPFQLHSSAVVRARAFASGYNPSAPSIASYVITAAAPTVQFVLASDNGPASTTTCFPVLALSAVPNETVAVRYTVRSPGRKVTSSSATFFPGDVYLQVPVPLSAAGTWRITIAGATGAILGPMNTFAYTMN